MEKVKIKGFGNEKGMYYFEIAKSRNFFVWLDQFTDLVKKLSASKSIIGNRLHDSEDDSNPLVFIDKHESYSADHARIDVFFAREVIFITLVSEKIKKDEFLHRMEDIAEFI